MVREGTSVTVTVHGEPVAEIRPIEKESAGLEARMSSLTESGVLIPAKASFRPQVRARRPGALKRFLDDRE